MFKTMKRRFWNSYAHAKKAKDDKPRYYVVGNGVMTMKASEVVRTKSFRDQLDASERIEKHTRVLHKG